jgi:hypothetical protein
MTASIDVEKWDTRVEKKDLMENSRIDRCGRSHPGSKKDLTE